MWEGHAIPQPDLGASLLGSSFGDPCRWPAVLTLGPVGLHSSTLAARCISAEHRATPSRPAHNRCGRMRSRWCEFGRCCCCNLLNTPKSFRTCKVTNPPPAAVPRIRMTPNTSPNCDFRDCPADMSGFIPLPNLHSHPHCRTGGMESSPWV